MLQVTSPASIAKIRYQAKKRGFRVLRDGCGCFALIDTKVEPPRPLIGVDHVPLWVIEQVIFTPLPEPKPRRQRMARPNESAPVTTTVQAAVAVETAPPAHGQAHSFLSLVEALRTRSAS
jgi:hypothetical protein